jgi:hypothetical protein
MFIENELLMPLQVKDIFHKKFPNIEINLKDIDSYIKTKYREIKKIHSVKIKNTQSFFEFYDKSNNKFSTLLNNKDNNNDNKEYKMILFDNNKMYLNLKNNKTNQYFMDCTYKIVPPNKNNFRLMVLSGLI